MTITAAGRRPSAAGSHSRVWRQRTGLPARGGLVLAPGRLGSCPRAGRAGGAPSARRQPSGRALPPAGPALAALARRLIQERTIPQYNGMPHAASRGTRHPVVRRGVLDPEPRVVAESLHSTRDDGQAVRGPGAQTGDAGGMPTTFTALAVAVVAILPGAAFLLAFEARSGSYKVGVPDRLIRFLVASATLHAFVSGATYYIYKTQIVTGRLAQGKVSIWLVELVAIAYAVLPFVAGRIVGVGYAKGWRFFKWFHRRAFHPRAWDHVFSSGREAYVRLRLNDGTWIAEGYGTFSGRIGSYASAYGEDQDLYLDPTIEIDPKTGVFAKDADGHPVQYGGGILIRWSEVKYAELIA